MNRTTLWLCIAAAFLVCTILCLFGLRESTEDTGKRIVFIAGQPSHGEGNHEWDQDARFLKQCLSKASNVSSADIEIYYNGWPQEPRDLDNADAIVFLSDGFEDHPLAEPERLARIRKLAKKGVGLVLLHYSIHPPPGAEADFLEWMGGYYERGFSQNPINTVKVSPVRNGHPISRGCGGYVVEDEWYFDIRFRQEEQPVVPVMTGRLPPRAPEDKALAWALERGDGGRGFGFAGGHYHRNWHMEPFRKLVLNGILWSAGMDVPEKGVISAEPWRFVSMPDFVNVDLTYPQPGWEDALGYFLKAVKAEDPEFVLVAGQG
jgi:type 1 glutamine amidotransferase